MKISFLLKSFLVLVFIASLLIPLIDKSVKPKQQQDNKESIDKPIVTIPETPLHQVKLPDFNQFLDIKQKKKAFFNFLRPAIITENSRLMVHRKQIYHWLEIVSLEQGLTDKALKQINTLAGEYKISGHFTLLQKLHELLVRVDIVPVGLVLVQAANESAWGTSRFARIGLNFFGIWCYRPGCGMVPKGREPGANHQVAAFTSVNAAVRHYLYNINTNNAYSMLRTIRAELRAKNEPLSAQVLATGLLAYSQRGADYVLEISQMIRDNQAYLGNELTE